MNQAATIDVAIREPAGFEFDRVRYLFGNTPPMPEARFIAATRSRPVERFIAAVAWWPVAKAGHFQIASQPGVARGAVAAGLIDGLAADAKLAGMESLQCATLLTEDNEWLRILQTEGFESSHSEAAFEVSYRDAWIRLTRLHQKHLAKIPSGWSAAPVQHHPPEIVLDLLAPHRLLTPASLSSYYDSDSEPGCEPGLSCILFDGQKPFGLFLARRMGDGVYIDAQVVREANPRLRSLGDLFMLHHQAQRVVTDESLRWLWFRSGQTEHRQTANLAYRMGGREKARAHLLARAL